jgi:hypothetical protein
VKHKTSVNSDEEEVLKEIERFASWMLQNKRYMTIFLTPKQHKIWKTLCGRLTEHKSVIDTQQLVLHIDVYHQTYRGFRILKHAEGKRHTKKDLMPLPL